MPATEPRLRLPIKVFLQGTVALAVAVLVLALALLMYGYASQASLVVGRRLAEAEADAAAVRVAAALAQPLRAARFLSLRAELLHDAGSGKINCTNTIQTLSGLPISCADAAIGEAVLRAVSLAGQNDLDSMWSCRAAGHGQTNVSVVNTAAANRLLVTLTRGITAFEAEINTLTGAVREIQGAIPRECAAPDGMRLVVPGSASAFAQFTPLRDPSTGVVDRLVVSVFAVANSNRSWAGVRVVLNATELLSPSKTDETDLYPVDFGLIDVRTKGQLIALLDSRGTSREPLSASSSVPGPFQRIVESSSTVDAVSLFEQVQRALAFVIFITIGIGVAIGAASTMIVLMFVRPVMRLSSDMTALGRLDVGEVALHRSLLTEVELISRIVADLLELVRELRRHIPEGDEEEARDAAAQALLQENEADLHVQHSMQQFKVRVDVVYESRKTANEIAAESFDFFYTEAEGRLFERLCDECRDACEEDEFEPVSLMFTNANGETVVLQHSVQLSELLAAAPPRIEITMQKTSQARYGIVVTGTFDVVNAVVTIAYAGYLLRGGVDKTASVPFICLYVFALGMNLTLCLVLLRRAAEKDSFQRWLQRSTVEIAVCCVLCTANLQDMEVLWSSIKFKRYLSFNAPEHPELLQRAVSMSLFGFLFSDVAQLLFKIWLVVTGIDDNDFSYLALATSALSVLFNMIVKLHAMLLWQGGNKANDQLERDAQADAGHLVWKDVSLVMAHFTLPSYIRQLQLQGIETNEFYNSAEGTIKRFDGVTLSMQSGNILAAFNVTRRMPCHMENAIACAVELTQQSAESSRPVNAVVVTGRMLTGMLGTITVKTMHCFADLEHMHRLVAVGAAANCPVLVSGSVMTKLGVERAIGESAYVHLVNDDLLRDGVDLAIGMPATLNDNVSRAVPAALPLDTAVGSSRGRRKSQRSQAKEAEDLEVFRNRLMEGAVGAVDCAGSTGADDLRPAEVAVATGTVALEEALAAAQRYLAAQAVARSRAAAAERDARNVHKLQTFSAASVLAGIL